MHSMEKRGQLQAPTALSLGNSCRTQDLAWLKAVGDTIMKKKIPTLKVKPNCPVCDQPLHWLSHYGSSKFYGTSESHFAWVNTV